jgi:SPP1 gp7 family putative phage head morphogenesis protein
MKKSSPYGKTDKTIEYLNKQYMKLFRSLTAFDEMNVIEVSREIYREVLKQIKQESTRLVKSVYKAHRDKGETISSKDANALVLALMLAYNPVTKYVFKNELDRKRARFAEGVISSDTPMEEVALAKRLLADMSKQFEDDVTFEAVIQAYRDDGVEKVRWITEADDRRCSECKSRHGKIYSIDNVPPKPHRHCRCYVEKVREN